MDDGRLGDLIRRLRRGTDPGAEGADDGQLLQQFAHHRDEAAFAALVDRHGPMVLGVCRRVLRDPHDADDAFQATFLVLAHKARSIGRPQALASWLYHTALRTALRAKLRRGRLRAREGGVADDLPTPEAVEDLAWHELRPALDEEVGRLPRKYRDAVVSCYLQEKTYAEAAQALGLAAGTVSSRLARARDILRKRLLRRGLTLSSGLLVSLLSRQALSAAVPGALRDATTGAALRLAAGQAVLAAATTGPAGALTQEVLNAMVLTKLKIGALLVLGAVCAGSAVFAYDRVAGMPGPARAEAVAPPATPPDGEKNAEERPDPGERWRKAAQRPGLSDREEAAYEHLAKLHLCAFEPVGTGARARHILNLRGAPDGPFEHLYRMGFDVLPQLAEALDDDTLTESRNHSYSERKKVYRVNELVARLIVELASHDFVLDPDPPAKAVGDPPGIRDLNANPRPAADFKKAVLDWYAANRDRTPAERKIADVNDPWFRNRFDAVEWLAEHKRDAGRRAIEKRVDAILAGSAEDTLVYSELSLCAEVLGRIGDKASLPQVRAVCQYLTNDDRWATGGAGPHPSRHFEAFHGLALLGEKDEALRGLKAVYEVRKDRMPEPEMIPDLLDRAGQW
jgi:RNA polymerase sigma factor (sigma-70 family)